MSDPNQPDQPYGAVPPPGFPPPPNFPPPGFPPPGGPAGPGFPPPGGPGPDKGKGKGLWFTLGVVGALALVGVVIALVLLLTGDDDGDDGDTGRGTDDSSAGVDGPAPDEVVESLVEAAEEGDCDRAKTFLTETAQAADPCASAEFRLLSTDDVESEIGDPDVDGSKASVPVGFTTADGTTDYVFNLEQVDGAWLIASYAIDNSSDGSTDGPTDGSTDAPTDGPTDSASGAPTPKGSSTADAVANDPKSVVEAFLDAVVSGDCATAEDLVTDAYLKKEGDCDASDLPSGFADQVVYTVGTPKVDDAAGTATVPVEVSFSGQEDTSTVELVKESGQWRISAFE